MADDPETVLPRGLADWASELGEVASAINYARQTLYDAHEWGDDLRGAECRQAVTDLKAARGRLDAPLEATIEGLHQLITTNDLDDSFSDTIRVGMAAAKGINAGDLALAGSILETVLGDLASRMEDEEE